jgi:hypothetical protein
MKFLPLRLLLVAAFTMSILPPATAEISDKNGAAATIFYWEAPTRSEMTWMTRDVLITKSGNATYFSIIGNWTPPFYLGIQEIHNSSTGEIRKNAIFSAWDTYEGAESNNLGPETRPINGRTTVVNLGEGVTGGNAFGGEGTGAQAFINDFGWKVGDRIRAVVTLRPMSDGTEVSAALQLNELKWRHFGTYKYAKKFISLEPGYSFIEDFGNTPRIVRAAEFGNTWMESEDSSIRTPINSVQGWANNGPNKNYHIYKQLNPTGLWAQAGGDEFTSKQEFVPFKIDVSQELFIPLEARISALNLSGEAQKSYEQKYLESKSNREAKAAADKAAVDKAASEVRITAAKTKYSELSSEIDRLIKQYPSKRSEIELYKKKIALFERIDQVNITNVELNLAGIESKLVAMRSVYGKIARTITCTKGKITKKVTDVAPKCPSGYKKK